MSTLKIAHLSDPHFGTILPGVREGLIASLMDINPDLILLTGDITQRARRWQFREAKEFTHQLPDTDLIAVPGNHDIPLLNFLVRLFDPYRGFKKYFKDQLERDHFHGDVVVAGLNSTSRWRHVQGDFNLQRLENRLKSVQPRAKVLIAAFHHPMDCRRPQDEKNLLCSREGAISLFDRYEVDLMIGGHIHDPYVTLSKVRYPNTRRNMVIGVAGTCTSWRTRADSPNSFNLIEVDTRSTPRIVFSRFDQRENKRFTMEHVHKFSRPDANGWIPE